MCWIGRNKPKIANKNIEVFKIVLIDKDGDFRSYHYGDCKWNLNKKEKSAFVINNSLSTNEILIHEGLHSFSTSCIIKHSLHHNSIFVKSKKDKIKLDRYDDDGDLYKMICIIPKGATYYLNKDGEYVSNALISIKFEHLT